MSGFSVTIKQATPQEAARAGGVTHEIILEGPNGIRRFTATGVDPARVIAQSWADFLGVETIDFIFTPVAPIPYITLQSIITNEKVSFDQNGERITPNPEG